MADIQTMQDSEMHNTTVSNNGDRTAKSKKHISLLECCENVVTGFYVPVFLEVFGIFALEAAGVANDQSLVANQLALLSLCSVQSSEVCRALLSQVDSYLPAIANTLYNVSSPPRLPLENMTDAIYIVHVKTSAYGKTYVLSSLKILQIVVYVFPWIFVLKLILITALKSAPTTGAIADSAGDACGTTGEAVTVVGMTHFLALYEPNFVNRRKLLGTLITHTLRTRTIPMSQTLYSLTHLGQTIKHKSEFNNGNIRK
ncbi:hypothetical protein F5884DRAFT_754078 [Xylogone sp. PMI_703]|nr:hypothetical protein F5884DRAFT_754078 [Xylogone sp. PMI_703]